MELFFLINICGIFLFFYLILNQLTLKEKAANMFMPVIAVNIFVGVIINHICSADIFTVFIALSTLYILILFFFLYSHTRKRHTARPKNIIPDEEYTLQQLQQQYDSILDAVEMLRTWKHDLTQHLETLNYYVTNQQLSQAADYIQSLQGHIHRTIPIASTGNYVVDAVLSNKMFIMNLNGIQFNYKVLLPPQLPLDEINTCSLLGNILDNAIESCLKLKKTEDAYVKLCIQPYKDSLLIELTNSSDGTYKFDSKGILLSTKSGKNHGIGLRHVIQLVESANGIYRLEPQKNTFTVHIILPLAEEEKKHGI